MTEEQHPRRMYEKHKRGFVGGPRGKWTKTVQLVDLERHTIPLGTTEHDTERGPRCYAQLPYDFPAAIRVMRLIDNWTSDSGATHSGELRGRTFELDLYTVGVKVWVRQGTDGSLKVFLEDSEGMEKVAEYITQEESE